MDEEPRTDVLLQKQEIIFARLQPASEFEEHLARQIAACSCLLEQIEDRLTKAWCQLQKIHAELEQ